MFHATVSVKIVDIYLSLLSVRNLVRRTVHFVNHTRLHGQTMVFDNIIL